ncbi:hypothetical protein D3C80_1085260 [compost metagenome]
MPLHGVPAALIQPALLPATGVDSQVPGIFGVFFASTAPIGLAIIRQFGSVAPAVNAPPASSMPVLMF